MTKCTLIATRYHCLALLLMGVLLRPSAAVGQIPWKNSADVTPLRSASPRGDARRGPDRHADRGTEDLAARESSAENLRERHVLIQFDRAVDADTRAATRDAGFELLRYVGDGAYFAFVARDVDEAALGAVVGWASIREIQVPWKMHPSLSGDHVPAHAIVDGGDPDDPIVAVYVVFHSDTEPVAMTADLVQKHGVVVRSQLQSVNGLVVELRLSKTEAVASEDGVQWIEPALPQFSETLDSARAMTQVDDVQTLGAYGLDGSGINVLVYDSGGALEVHPDFGGRLTVRDGSLFRSHATHVSGIVGGSGFASGGLWRGVAPAVVIESFAFEPVGGGVGLYTDPGDLENDYTEAFGALATQVANNSIGTNVCSNGFDCRITGDYGVTSQLIDALVAGALGETVRIVWSAGNERGCDRCAEEGVHTFLGFRSIAPPAGAKNPIVVGAVNSDDGSVAAFSGFGPTDDGRLKPDMVAPGCQISDDFGVTSTTLLGSYTQLCGTSMSAPMVTGAVALLLQDLQDRFPGDAPFSNALIKGLLIHSAADVEQTGPDYKTGYGLLQVRDAVDLARTGQFRESTLAHDEVVTFGVQVSPDDTELKVTLVWDDVPGVPNVVPALVNDLDLRVFAPDGGLHYPWTLDPGDPVAAAQRNAPDRVNNVEQVVVQAPPPGTWRVEVAGHRIPLGAQAFAISFSHALTVDCDGDGTPDDEQIADTPALDCGNNGILDICESDCDGDGIVDTCALADGDSRDCDRNGIPDDCEPFSDCNGNGVHDACDIADLFSGDCDENQVPDECDIDCNTNNIPDACELSGGSADCDDNGQFDLCEPWFDCNNNLVSDRCEVARGLVDDFNDNGVPDSCDPQRRVWQVDVGGCTSDPNGSESRPFCLIQDAINASISGDTVVIAPGVYAGVGNRNLDYGGRLITVRSSNPDDTSVVEATIVDCEHRGRGFYFHSQETQDAILDGITIINGLASGGGTPGAVRGGGIYLKNSDPTILRCVITGCMTAPTIFAVFGGGGIYCDHSSPTVERCDISANTTFNFGGGLYAFDDSHPVVRDTVIQDNVGFGGAGIAVDLISSVVLERCLVSWNTTLTGGGGGGVVIGGLSELTIRDSLVVQNESTLSGGGLSIAGSSAVSLDHVTIADNVTDQPGGGGIFGAFQSTSTMTGSLLWGNRSDGVPDQVQLSSQASLSVSYSDIQGGADGVIKSESSSLFWEEGNIDSDPLFVDSEDADYHLGAGSPCVDAGNPERLPGAGEVDRDGHERTQHCQADMGAFESSHFVDCNGNALGDRCEIQSGSAQDCNDNGIPDSCEDTSADCNSNGIWDLCEIADGSLADCNANDRPDSCDLADGVAPDCNENNVPDSCDVSSDVSDDVNANGVPDECEVCVDDNECDDGVWCNGAEACVSGTCIPGTPPCFGQVCVETALQCLDCATDDDCDDDDDCTLEFCNHGMCEVTIREGECDDGQLCTQGDVCTDGECRGVLVPGCSVNISLRAVAINGDPIVAGPADSVEIYPGELVTCEILIEGWAPDALRLYQVGITDEGYFSGSRGSLLPLVEPDPSAGLFIEQNREDFVFFGVPALVGVLSLDTSLYILGGFSLFGEGCRSDVGSAGYLGTLVLRASEDAGGIFTVCPDGRDDNSDLEPENTFLLSCESLPMVPIELGCVSVTVVSDCNNNGIPDDKDLESGTSEDCTGNGFPDECEPDCNGNGVADSCDIADGVVLDCNDNNIPDPCDIAEEFSADCNRNAIPDECEPDCNGNDVADACDVSSGSSADCDQDGVPDECQDCNDNGIGDACEIADGTSADCNGNGRPDECDFDDGSSVDCDLNGVPDECEDTSVDCDGNGVWDLCDLRTETHFDCNGNLVPDVCDIAQGLSRDCDENALPDECLDLFPRSIDAGEVTAARGALFHGISDEDNVGRSLTGVGDVNNDGIDDFALAAVSANNVGALGSGEVYVLFGRPGGWESPFELSQLLPGSPDAGIVGLLIHGISGGDFLGEGISGGGDVNGDGVDDLVIGAPGVDLDDDNTGIGEVYVIYGRAFLGAAGIVDLASLNGVNGFAMRGAEAQDRTGGAVSIARDINGDGIDDILMSAHTATAQGQGFAGRSLVVFGSSAQRPAVLPLADLLPENGGDGSLGFAINGIDMGDLSGFSLAGVGDVNGDGFGDIVVGSYPADAHGNPFTGETYLIFGSSTIGSGGAINLDELDGDNGVTLRGIDLADLSGHDVSAAGDVNRDGLDDFLIGGVWADPGGRGQAGETYLVFGHVDPWPAVVELSALLPENGGDGSQGVVFNGVAAGDLSSFAVAAAGDVNGDEADDIVIGAYFADPRDVARAGEVYVVFGHPDPWVPVVELASLFNAATPPEERFGFTVFGGAEDDLLGFSVAGGGDVNADGIDDVLIGAPSASLEDADLTGVSYLILGRRPESPDCNENGNHDLCDILDGTSTDCDFDGVPDDCLGSLEDCNGNGRWDLCDIRLGDSEDCNGNDIPDKCDIADGISEDCNHNVIPDECEDADRPDCNDNQTWDACDIFLGVSRDCNGNGVPDECDPGAAQDCNGNLTPDACDIAEGVSADVNANGIPDECEPLITLLVDVDGCDSSTGGSGSEGDPFCTIQGAIDAAGDGQTEVIEIVLADGIYTGDGNHDLNFGSGLGEGRTRSLTLRSAAGPYRTLIDLDEADHFVSFTRGETRGSRIKGLTIIGARRGAIECINGSNPVIDQCIISRNLGFNGAAGIRCVQSSPTITRSIVSGNFVRGIGCAIQSSPLIRNCLIAGNHGGEGGGMIFIVQSNPTIESCTIANNTGEFGGGAFFSSNSEPAVSNSILYGNALNEITGPASVSFSTVALGHPGPGNIDLDPQFVTVLSGTWTSPPEYDAVVRKSSIHDDNASWIEDSLIGALVNLNLDGVVQLEFVIIDNTPTSITIWGTDWDLAEIDATYRITDYHLGENSPCVNAGDINMQDVDDIADLDGNARLLHCRLDMGAFESTHAVDCDDNGFIDACEALDGLIEDCNENATPDACETDCNENLTPDDCDIANGTARDVNQNGIPDVCDVRVCDLDGSGVVDNADRAFMNDCVNGVLDFDVCAHADYNDDGLIDSEDLLIFADCFFEWASSNGGGAPDQPSGSRRPQGLRP